MLSRLTEFPFECSQGAMVCFAFRVYLAENVWLYVHVSPWANTSVTRLGEFWNLLPTNFLIKVAQIFFCFLGNLQIVTFHAKPAVTSFGETIGKFGLLFIPTSGHTGQKARKCLQIWALANSKYGLAQVGTNQIGDSLRASNCNERHNTFKTSCCHTYHLIFLYICT